MPLYKHAFIRATEVPARCEYKKRYIPRLCYDGKWHVWRWRSESDDSTERPPVGSACQCGARKEGIADEGAQPHAAVG